jgi:hypothetical protein
MIGLAIFVHAGIGMALGMQTFGLVMIIANLAFIYPEYVEATITALGRLFVRPPASAPAETATSDASRSDRRRIFASAGSP